MDGHQNLAAARDQPRLLDQVRHVIRRLHYSIRTEQAYVDWIRRFILFHQKRPPKEMGAPEVEAFLSHLAVQGRVAASTQNQALNAIVFLYRKVLKKELGWLEGVERAKKPSVPTMIRAVPASSAGRRASSTGEEIEVGTGAGGLRYPSGKRPRGVSWASKEANNVVALGAQAQHSGVRLEVTGHVRIRSQ